MSDTAFTPGPWCRGQNWRGKLAVCGPRNDGKRTDSDRICNLPRRKNGEGRANQALIAAAPDLYEALVFARSRLSADGHVVDDIDAALAKALLKDTTP